MVLLRDGDAGLETLLLERPPNSRSFGGAWVFPGGKVDPEDRRDENGGTIDDLTAAQRAGLREVAEETGQALGHNELLWLSQWTPMQRLPRRFRTWFMLAPAVSDAVSLNAEEHSNFAWLPPAAALTRHAQGTLKLVPPTWVTLHHLMAKSSVAEALAEARSSRPFHYNTQWLQPDGVTSLEDRPTGVMWPGDATYPQRISAGPEARHRLTTVSLPWIFERVAG